MGGMEMIKRSGFNQGLSNQQLSVPPVIGTISLIQSLRFTIKTDRVPINRPAFPAQASIPNDFTRVEIHESVPYTYVVNWAASLDIVF
jgi:hypothetical protein